jgi:pathogenesis-related protein 1
VVDAPIARGSDGPGPDVMGTLPPPEPDGTAPGGDSGSPGDDSGGGGGDSGATGEENEWLAGMNQARMEVGEQPLTWNPIAAQVAANYAAMCNYAHNPNASSQYDAMGGSGGLGENIAAGAPTEDPQQGVAAWVAEKANYDHATNSCASGDDCSHYTQIVWSTTTSVGCAHVSCTMNTPFGSGFPDWDFNVCDYAPPGNYVGEAPY